MPLPIASRLLTAWHRTVQSGLSITPAQYIVLCSIIEEPALSSMARARRLHLSSPTILLAQRTLAELRLIKLTTAPHSPYQQQRKSRLPPAIHAHPTPAARKLFTNRAGRKPSASPAKAKASSSATGVPPYAPWTPAPSPSLHKTPPPTA